MSWSINAKGTPEDVGKQVADKFATITYLVGAEAELKDNAKALIDQAVAAQKGVAEVSVSAFGSSYRNGENESQSITISVATNGFTNGLIE